MTQALREAIDAYRVSRVICVAAELGIPDLLKRAPLSADALAEETGTHPPSLLRLLRALCSLGVLESRGDGRFAVAAAGEPLCQDAAGSLKAWAVFSSRLYGGWSGLLDAVRMGEGGTSRRWKDLAQAPGEAQIFNDAMSANALAVAKALLGACDLSGFGTIVDVGGGSGMLLGAVLAAHPHVRGILHDQAAAIADARQRLAEIGLADRCRLHEGNFFQSVPEGGDLYLLSRVLHDWDDDRATDILRCTRRAMRQGASLMVLERILEPDRPSLDCAMSDLNMLVMNGGRERTAAQFEALLGQSGLRLLRIVETPTPIRIVDARAV